MPQAPPDRALLPAETLPPYGTKIPTSIIEAMQVVEEQTNRVCYLVNAALKGHKLSPYGHQFLTFDGDPHNVDLKKLNWQLAKEFFPASAAGWKPFQDFLAQQLMLGFMAKQGQRSLPDVLLTVTKRRNGRTDYYRIRTRAQHLFATDHTYIGALCWMDLLPIQEADYRLLASRDEMVLPHPDDLLPSVPKSYQREAKALLVAHRAGKQISRMGAAIAQRLWGGQETATSQKTLPQEQPDTRLRDEPQPDVLPVPDRPQFHTVDDLKRIANFKALEAALASAQGAGKQERKEMALVIYHFAVDVWKLSQTAIKTLIWGKDVPNSGDATPYTTKEKYIYFRIQKGGSTLQKDVAIFQETEEAHPENTAPQAALPEVAAPVNKTAVQRYAKRTATRRSK
jgi:hypothetical protein